MYFQQNHRRKSPYPKEGDDYQGVNSIPNMKETGPEEKLSLLYNNSNINCTEERKDI